MKLIEVPVIFQSEISAELMELGLNEEPEFEEGIAYINPECIEYINDSYSDYSIIQLCSGVHFRSSLTAKDVYRLLA